MEFETQALSYARQRQHLKEGTLLVLRQLIDGIESGVLDVQHVDLYYGTADFTDRHGMKSLQSHSGENKVTILYTDLNAAAMLQEKIARGAQDE